ncbi:hypothetical protein [Deinococcus misasensis]|uniref:hypothetical protein n=1 Tax=Deinococcus misasensis TaxID=392413 RepID=UPI00054DD49C|nr:hypothetical protein [Deinococcus misasensis]
MAYKIFRKHRQRHQKILWRIKNHVVVRFYVDPSRTDAYAKYRKSLHLSVQTCSRTGAKPYKRKYHKLRRSQARKLEYFALMEMEEQFDRIAPDGFKGAIGWDLW